MKTSILRNKKISLVSIIVTVMIWQLLALLVNWELKLPSPLATASKILEIVTDAGFFVSVGRTLFRSFISFIVTLILGTILGFISGINGFVEAFLEPVVAFIKSTPTIAVILFVLMWVDYSVAPIIIGGLILFPIIYNNVLHGIRDVDNQLIEMGTVYKFSKEKMIREIYLPSIREFLYASVLTGAGLNIKVVIASEVLGGSGKSIGRSLQYARANVDTVSILAWIFIVVAIVALIDEVIKLLNRKLRLR